MKIDKILAYFTGLALLIIFEYGCTPKQVIVQNTQNSAASPRISESQGDTVTYSIDFLSKGDREKFLSSFRMFLKEYPSTNVKDEEGGKVFVKILPVNDSGKVDKQIQILSNQPSEYVEHIIQKTIDSSISADSINQADTVIPQYGGSIRIYSPRGTLDEIFAPLFEIYPFGNDSASVMMIADSSERRITLRLNGKVTNGKGKIISALDIIEYWTNLIKNHPAEGLALFRYVEGVRAFIDGREAVVRGFFATDQNTVQLRLSQVDSNAIERVRTSRLLGSTVRLGAYFIEEQSGNDVTLAKNKIGKISGYLDKILIKTGGESNPLLSFSLKKYDAVVLNNGNELEYARNNLAKSGVIDLITKDRYFISCNNLEPSSRKLLISTINRSEILKNFIKAEGELISAVESDSNEIFQENGEITDFSDTKLVRILYRKDDPVSKIIAEKLLADLSKNHAQGTLVGVIQTEYERMLISNNYSCAIGWTSEKILNDKSEKLRLATMWFNDETDWKNRIRDGQEIPLFSINNYLLHKEALYLPPSNFSGIFLR